MRLAFLPLLAVVAFAQPGIHLRTRDLADRQTPRIRRIEAGRHYIVQFASYPDRETLDQLSGRGIRVLEYVPENALMVSVPAAGALDGLGVVFVGSLDASDKIAPGLSLRSTNTFLAMFHADVSADRARALAEASGFDVIENPDLAPNHLVLTGAFDRLAELAARDELAYVLPASIDLVNRMPVMRCPGPAAAAGRIGEYAMAGQGWSRDAAGQVALKYVIQTLTTKVDVNTARNEIERALREWPKYAGVTISSGDRADALRTIAIRFASKEHGDGYPFDGPGRVLAHTFYPFPVTSEPLAGDMHLDADEDWHAGANVDIFSVALHEAGHALGLGHSTDPASVMYPYYRFATTLGTDDIAGIQNLYGKPASTQPVAPTPTNPVPPPTTPVKDSTAPALQIVTPGSTIVSTYAASVSISGTASDNVAVTAVKWSTGAGDSGTAAGTTAWSASIRLLTGTNVITIRVYDAAGNSGWRAITVVKH